MPHVKEVFELMKRFLLMCLALMILALQLNISAFAAENAGVDIGVTISNGGTAVIVTEVNSPFPSSSKLTLEDGKDGVFHIDFDAPGIYNYEIMVMPDDREITYDTTVYTARVSVKETDRGLDAYLFIFDKATQEKQSEVRFENTLLPPTEPPTEPQTHPVSTLTATESTLSGHQPQTGDDTKMEMYLLIAMIASAGLFMLAVMYTVDTNKLCKKKKKRA